MCILKNISILTIILVFGGCTKPKVGFDFTIVSEHLTLKLNQTKRFHVQLYNNSDSIVKIDRIKTSCQCLTPSDTQLSIQPHGDATIDLFIHPARIGEQIETIVFINNALKRFKLHDVEYIVNP